MVSYLPWVQEYAARRAATLPAQSILDADDLVNEGMMALSAVMETFDSSRGVKFTTYAARRVWGAMNDALRATDHLPRLMRKRINAGTVDDVHIGSLEQVVSQVGDRNVTVGDQLEDRASRIVEAAMHTRDAMQHLLTGLQAPYRLVLTLYYVEQMTMKEVGKVIGLSESRVSQMHSQALDVLRSKWAAAVQTGDAA